MEPESPVTGRPASECTAQCVPHLLKGRRTMATAKKAKKAAKKPTAKKAPAKKAPAKKPAAKKSTAKRKPNAAFMKPMTPSGTLAAVVGSMPMPRTDVTKKIWDYIKKNKLQDNINRRL